MSLTAGLRKLIAEKQSGSNDSHPRAPIRTPTPPHSFRAVRYALQSLLDKLDSSHIQSRIRDDRAEIWIGYDETEVVWEIKIDEVEEFGEAQKLIGLTELDDLSNDHPRQTELSFADQAPMLSYLQRRIGARLSHFRDRKLAEQLKRVGS